MGTKCPDIDYYHNRTTTSLASVSVFLLLLCMAQGREEIERNRRSTQSIDLWSLNQRPIKFVKTEESSCQALSEECEINFRNWMHDISPTMFHKNATLVVDWSELDKKLTEKNCSYNRLWIELWRVSENGLTPNIIHSGKEDELHRESIYGTPEYFSKFERCNELDETRFRCHSTREHDSLPTQMRKEDTLSTRQKYDKIDPFNEENTVISVDQSDGHVGLTKLEPTYSTKTTFFHVVEKRYILRLCPCVKASKFKRLCDCDQKSALCSGIIDIDQPERANTIDSFPTISNSKEKESLNALDEGNTVPLLKNAITINSPTTTCNSVVLAGSLTSCTSVQSYDRVKVILYPVRLDIIGKTHEQLLCSWGEAWYEDSMAIAQISDLEIADGNGTRGYFSVNIEGLKENSTFCVVVELVNHPYCDSHLTVGHLNHQTNVCTNHVLHPVVLPKCTYRYPGTVGNDVWSSESSRIIIGCLAGTVGILAIIGIFMISSRCKKKTCERNDRGNLQPTKHSPLIIKDGEKVPNSQETSCTITLLS